MQVTVLYFAGLRSAAGVERELIDAEGLTLVALYAQLRERHGWRFEQGVLRVAVNDELADWSRPVQDGDVIAFLPPFSGG